MTCPKCFQDDFNSLGRCRPCWAAYMKNYNHKNPEKLKTQRKKYRQTNSYKNSCLKHYYHISLEEYNKLLKQQNNVCAICGKEESDKHKNGIIKRLSVDHCHITGKIRGLLCNKCNKGIGMFNDNYDLLKQATAYLER